QRFQSLYLTEKEPAFTVLSFPVFEQGTRDGSDVAIFPASPEAHTLADVIDVVVFLRPVLGPFSVERGLPCPLSRRRDRNEIAAGAAFVIDVIRDAVLVELVVPARFLEGGIEDGV